MYWLKESITKNYLTRHEFVLTFLCCIMFHRMYIDQILWCILIKSKYINNNNKSIYQRAYFIYAILSLWKTFTEILKNILKK